ncbi:thiamine-phosphate kinase [Luteitalea sp.]|uniref:thiamine-phosphate kinase n=1 Tax=Luteitalea sp. TaxID=2004800 RepID=UPI0025BE1DFE|nr:thiamine-phosphate kinase [Luteitalea sp.]
MTRTVPPGWDHAPSATCGSVGEHALIHWISTTVGAPASKDVLIGIGDDAAVVVPRRNHVDVLTTDVQVDGVHFTRTLSSPADVGHRALHTNLSDIAAMGAEPRVALLSLGLPADLEAVWVAELVQGLVTSARAAHVHLIGGNISRSPVLFIDVTVSGAVKPRHVLRRGGARPGDELYVSGEVGAAAAGLAWLQHDAVGRAGSPSRPSPHDAADAGHDDGRLGQPAVPTEIEAAILRYRRPEARVALGMQIGRNKAASACMDTSDGLADALRQLAAASGVGVRVETATVPVSPAVALVAERLGADPQALTWSGGEDYELLFAVPRRARRRFLHASGRKGLPLVTRIGLCTKESALVLVDGAGTETVLPGGFEHFGGTA